MYYRTLIEQMHTIQMSMALFGCDEEFNKTYLQKTSAIGDAIANELGISKEEVPNSKTIRESTIATVFTSPEVETAYKDFEDWYKEVTAGE